MLTRPRWAVLPHAAARSEGRSDIIRMEITESYRRAKSPPHHHTHRVAKNVPGNAGGCITIATAFFCTLFSDRKGGSIQREGK